MSKVTKFYYPSMSSIDSNGSIEMKVSTYDDESHESGILRVNKSNENYEFWRFVISVSERYPYFIGENEIERLKLDYDSKNFTS